MLSKMRIVIIFTVFCILLPVSLIVGNDLNQNNADNVVAAFKKSSEEDLFKAQEMFKKLEEYEGPKTVESVLVPLNELLVVIDRGENLAHL